MRWDMGLTSCKAKGHTENPVLARISRAKHSYRSFPALCARLTQLEEKCLSVHTRFLSFWIFKWSFPVLIIVHLWCSLVLVACLTAISITPTVQKATFEDYQVIFDLWVSLSLNNVQQIFSKQWLLWVRLPAFPSLCATNKILPALSLGGRSLQAPWFPPVGMFWIAWPSIFLWGFIEPKPSWKQSWDKPCWWYRQAEVDWQLH